MRTCSRQPTSGGSAATAASWPGRPRSAHPPRQASDQSPVLNRDHKPSERPQYRPSLWPRFARSLQTVRRSPLPPPRDGIEHCRERRPVISCIRCSAASQRSADAPRASAHVLREVGSGGQRVDLDQLVGQDPLSGPGPGCIERVRACGPIRRRV